VREGQRGFVCGDPTAGVEEDVDFESGSKEGDDEERSEEADVC